MFLVSPSVCLSHRIMSQPTLYLVVWDVIQMPARNTINCNLVEWKNKMNDRASTKQEKTTFSDDTLYTGVVSRHMCISLAQRAHIPLL